MKLTDKDRFKRACLKTGDPFEGLDPIKQKQKIESLKLLWMVSDKCRECGEVLNESDFSVWFTYWNTFWAPSHAECLKIGFPKEVYECQCIDTSCSDCKHFQRGKERVWPAIGFGDLPFPSAGKGNGTFDGYCLKLDRPTIAHSNHCYLENSDCFEHRKSS